MKNADHGLSIRRFLLWFRAIGGEITLDRDTRINHGFNPLSTHVIKGKLLAGTYLLITIRVCILYLHYYRFDCVSSGFARCARGFYDFTFGLDDDE